MLDLFETIGGFTYDPSILWVVQLVITSFIFFLVLFVYKVIFSLFTRIK